MTTFFALVGLSLLGVVLRFVVGIVVEIAFPDFYRRWDSDRGHALRWVMLALAGWAGCGTLVFIAFVQASESEQSAFLIAAGLLGVLSSAALVASYRRLREERFKA